MNNFLYTFFWALTSCSILRVVPAQSLQDSLYVDHVWSGNPVGFDFLSDSSFQFLAYYDSNRNMTVAQRQIGDNNWVKNYLDEKVGWDSHNSVKLTIDSDGYIHVSGNMHVDSLVYFQSEKPYDVRSLKRKKSLVGSDESDVTYPEFLNLPDGGLIFSYRSGSSGKGNQIYNHYDPETKKWKRLLEKPLVDGKGEMNAYLHGPILGPDGVFHMTWVWRDNPGAESNHDLSYAKSKDLVNWFQSDGSQQTLPITYDNCEIVDSVPIEGGLLNGNTVIGFDEKDRVVISYQKYDSLDYVQIYNARLEKEGWSIYKSTNWRFKWKFQGWGSINSRVGIKPVEWNEGRLEQVLYIDTVGREKYILDAKDLSTVEVLEVSDKFPNWFYKPSSPYEVVHFKKCKDTSKFILRWETLQSNRDQPRKGKLPPPSTLILYTIK